MSFARAVESRCARLLCPGTLGWAPGTRVRRCARALGRASESWRARAAMPVRPAELRCGRHCASIDAQGVQVSSGWPSRGARTVGAPPRARPLGKPPGQGLGSQEQHAGPLPGLVKAGAPGPLCPASVPQSMPKASRSAMPIVRGEAGGPWASVGGRATAVGVAQSGASSLSEMVARQRPPAGGILGIW